MTTRNEIHSSNKHEEELIIKEEEQIEQVEESIVPSTNNNYEFSTPIEQSDQVGLEEQPIQLSVYKKFLSQFKAFVWKIIKLSWDMLPIGFLSFGGPMAHTSLLQDRFVINHQWISPEEFSELFSICQSLPGPLSTKLVIAIGTLRGGYIGALVSFLIFSLPSGLIMGIVGVLMKDVDTDIQFPYWIKVALSGFSCAAVSIIMHAGYVMAKKLTVGNKLYQSLMIGAFVLFMIYQTWWMLLSIMIFGGLSNLITEHGGKYFSTKYESFLKLYNGGKSKVMKMLKFSQYAMLEVLTDLKSTLKRFSNRILKRSTIYEQVDESKKATPTTDVVTPAVISNTISNNSSSSIEMSSDISLKPMMGAIFISIFLVTLLSLFISRQFIEWTPLYLAEGFFRISSLIFGGGHVILPVILNEFSTNNNVTTLPTISEQQFLNGFALQNALPGPLFNLSAFVGGVIGGPLGAFISWFCSFLPPFLFMWTAIPLWNRYRDNKSVKIVLAGVNASSVGFVFVAGYVLWLSCVENQFVPAACTVVLSVMLQSVIDAPAPLVILSGGIIRLVLEPLSQK